VELEGAQYFVEQKGVTIDTSVVTDSDWPTSIVCLILVTKLFTVIHAQQIGSTTYIQAIVAYNGVPTKSPI
jgi:hypothetical protein